MVNDKTVTISFSRADITAVASKDGSWSDGLDKVWLCGEDRFLVATNGIMLARIPVFSQSEELPNCFLSKECIEHAQRLVNRTGRPKLTLDPVARTASTMDGMEWKWKDDGFDFAYKKVAQKNPEDEELEWLMMIDTDSMGTLGRGLTPNEPRRVRVYRTSSDKNLLLVKPLGEADTWGFLMQPYEMKDRLEFLSDFLTSKNVKVSFRGSKDSKVFNCCVDTGMHKVNGLGDTPMNAMRNAISILEANNVAYE